jgi:polar amino acid transport system permease protein
MGSLIDSETYRSFEVYAVVCGFYLAAALAFRLLLAVIYRVAFTRRMPAEPVVVIAP